MITADGVRIRQRFLEDIPSHITVVSRGFLPTLSLDGGRTQSKGLFLCYLGEEDYCAVNNSRGQDWRERFRNYRTACLWLQGHICLNIRNELVDGTTGETIYDVAERVRAESERNKQKRHERYR